MFPSRMLRSVVPALIVFLPTLFVLAQTERGPVPLPEGTWRPPPYSEQQRRVQQSPIEEKGIQVSGFTSKHYKWPLASIREGRIVCLPDFLVFFKAPSNVLYAINGSARDAIYDGRIDGRDMWTAGVLKSDLRPGNGYKVALLWIKVGLELCDGNLVLARLLGSEANLIAREPVQLR